MSAIVTEDVVEYGTRRRFPAVRWSAIFCGWLVGTGIAWLMYILGLAAGFSAIDISNVENIGRGLGIGTGLWLLLTWAVSLFLGGMFASWFDGKADPVVGTLHGVAVWALAMTASVLLVASGMGSLLQGGASILRAGASAGAIAAGAAAAGDEANEDPSMSALQSEVKQQIAMAIAGSGTTASGAQVNPAQVREAMEQIDRATTAAIAIDLMRGNADRAKARIAAETSLSPEQVERIMQNLSQRADQYKAQAKEAADKAAHYTAEAMWAVFVSCLIALIAAAIGGWVGASNVHRVYDLES